MSPRSRDPRATPPHWKGWAITGLDSIARLAAAYDAGKVDQIDRIRAVWRLQALVEACAAKEHERPRAAALLSRLDPGRTVPHAPTRAGLAWWLDGEGRNQPRGSVGRLAKRAGLHRTDLSRFRTRGTLTREKVERLGAALVAAGLLKSTPISGLTPKEQSS
jgi:hypothetical protein